VADVVTSANKRELPSLARPEPSWDWDDIRTWCLRSARRYVTGAAAEDVAHDALLRAWTARAECRRPDDPWPWLKRIVHNEAMRHLNLAASEALPIDGEPSAPDGRLETLLDREALTTLIGGLPESDRVLLRMHYELDLSVASLAAALGAPEGAVKVRLHRARRRLRASLEETRAAARDSG
jgi:RNA polymerase sigma-70 factor (ECF subfamily)